MSPKSETPQKTCRLPPEAPQARVCAENPPFRPSPNRSEDLFGLAGRSRKSVLAAKASYVAGEPSRRSVLERAAPA